MPWELMSAIGAPFVLGMALRVLPWKCILAKEAPIVSRVTYMVQLFAEDSNDKVKARTFQYPAFDEEGEYRWIEEEIQPVLTSIVCDFMMRCKLTAWRTPKALVNGGWCSCLTKQIFEGPKVWPIKNFSA